MAQAAICIAASLRSLKEAGRIMIAPGAFSRRYLPFSMLLFQGGKIADLAA
jgi:hypothetical protein